MLVDWHLYKEINSPGVVSTHRSALILTLLQRLVSPPSPLATLQNTSVSIEEQRDILQLLHTVLKHHRQWTRKGIHQPAGVPSPSTTGSKHAAIDIVKLLSSRSDFWIETLNRLLKSRTTQFELLTVLIDLEKARWIPVMDGQSNLGHDDVELCHDAIVKQIYQVRHTPPFPLH